MTLTALALNCTLLFITDGDTFRAACPEPVIVRIADIDAPELDACPRDAARSADTLASLLTGKITLQPLYPDRYGRTVATVTAQGRDVGQAMLDAGAAKEWPHDSKGRAQQPRPKWKGCK
jgi:endonuclease YncB( thermonuclease family)